MAVVVVKRKPYTARPSVQPSRRYSTSYDASYNKRWSNVFQKDSDETEEWRESHSSSQQQKKVTKPPTIETARCNSQRPETTRAATLGRSGDNIKGFVWPDPEPDPWKPERVVTYLRPDPKSKNKLLYHESSLLPENRSVGLNGKRRDLCVKPNELLQPRIECTSQMGAELRAARNNATTQFDDSNPTKLFHQEMDVKLQGKYERYETRPKNALMGDLTASRREQNHVSVLSKTRQGREKDEKRSRTSSQKSSISHRGRTVEFADSELTSSVMASSTTQTTLPAKTKSRSSSSSKTRKSSEDEAMSSLTKRKEPDDQGQASSKKSSRGSSRQKESTSRKELKPTTERTSEDHTSNPLNGKLRTSSTIDQGEDREQNSKTSIKIDSSTSVTGSEDIETSGNSSLSNADKTTTNSSIIISGTTGCEPNVISHQIAPDVDNTAALPNAPPEMNESNSSTNIGENGTIESEPKPSNNQGTFTIGNTAIAPTVENSNDSSKNNELKSDQETTHTRNKAAEDSNVERCSTINYLITRSHVAKVSDGDSNSTETSKALNGPSLANCERMCSTNPGVQTPPTPSAPTPFKANFDVTSFTSSKVLDGDSNSHSLQNSISNDSYAAVRETTQTLTKSSNAPSLSYSEKSASTNSVVQTPLLSESTILSVANSSDAATSTHSGSSSKARGGVVRKWWQAKLTSTLPLDQVAAAKYNDIASNLARTPWRDLEDEKRAASEATDGTTAKTDSACRLATTSSSKKHNSSTLPSVRDTAAAQNEKYTVGVSLFGDIKPPQFNISDYPFEETLFGKAESIKDLKKGKSADNLAEHNRRYSLYNGDHFSRTQRTRQENRISKLKLRKTLFCFGSR